MNTYKDALEHKTKTVVCAYVRVSTDSEAQHNSFENQQSYFSSSVSSREGYELFKIYADRGLSGVYWKKRKEFNKMITDAGIDIVTTFNPNTKKDETHYYVNPNRKPKFDEIWIKNTARFARNTFAYDVIELLLEKDVGVRFVTQNLFSKNEFDIAQIKTMMVLDENESRLKSNNVKLGYIEGAKKGHIYTHPSITGYDYDKANNALRKNKDAETVKLIFELYTEQNMGVRKIINELERRGIKSPAGNKRWGNTTIKNILHQEKYMGKNNPLRLDHGTFGHKTWAHRKPEYEVYDTDRIDAIISEETWDKAQALLKERVITLNNQVAGKKVSYSRYAKKLCCEQCGKSYIRNTDYKDVKKTKKYVFFNCATKKKLGKIYCDNPNVLEETLDEKIKAFSYGAINKEIKIRRTTYRWLLAKAADLRLDDIDKSLDEKAELLEEQIERQKAKVEDVFEKMYSMMRVNANNEEDYAYKLFRNKLEAESLELERMEREHQELIKHNEEILEEVFALLDEFKVVRDSDLVVKNRYSENDILAMIDKIYIGKKYDDSSKPDIMFTYVYFKNAHELLKKYEDKYNFTTENFERSKEDKIDSEEEAISRLWDALKMRLGEAYDFS